MDFLESGMVVVLKNKKKTPQLFGTNLKLRRRAAEEGLRGHVVDNVAVVALEEAYLVLAWKPVRGGCRRAAGCGGGMEVEEVVVISGGGVGVLVVE